MPKSNTTERIEYVTKAKNANGEIFVPNAFQSDITKALERFDSYRNGLEAKSSGATVTLEKRFITTKTQDFTKTALNMLKEMK